VTRILHIASELPPEHFGGLGTALAGLVGASRRAGTFALVLVVDSGGGYGYEGVRSYAASDSKPGVSRVQHENSEDYSDIFEHSFEGAIATGCRLVDEHLLDAIHLHSSWLWAIAEGIRRSKGIPIVYTAHSIIKPRSKQANGYLTDLSRTPQ
jgi:glycosyltransferase involved in cell wall biosynthesis